MIFIPYSVRSTKCVIVYPAYRLYYSDFENEIMGFSKVSGNSAIPDGYFECCFVLESERKKYVCEICQLILRGNIIASFPVFS